MTGEFIKLKIQSFESVIIGATISLMHVKRENPMHRKFQLRFMQFYYYIVYCRAQADASDVNEFTSLRYLMYVQKFHII